MTTDKASVAALDEIRAFFSGVVFRFEYDNGRPWAEGRRMLDSLRALSPAQGDGMRDALVKVRDEFIAPGVRFDSGNRYSDMLDKIDAALASHPDRQPGMTDEQLAIEVFAVWHEQQGRPHSAFAIREAGTFGALTDKETELLPLVQAAIAAIKRASQGET